MTTKDGIVLDDPLSALIYSSISLSFMLAHIFAAYWVSEHGKNTDLDALKAA
jgi:hypothetical protein